MKANRFRRHAVPIMAAAVAILSVLAGLGGLAAATRGLSVERVDHGAVPVTIFRPEGSESAPVVVIAHGFAGSQQLMQPLAVTLARNGYLAVTFDFPGHGRHREPFVSSLMDRDKRLRILLGALEEAIELALRQPGTGGRLALVGHSMAGDVLAHYARAHSGQVSAMVLLSPYLSEQTSTGDLDRLLLIYGALEPEMLQEQGLSVISEGLSEQATAGVVYGDVADGSARSLVEVSGVEHIGVLYARESLNATLDWIDMAFGRQGSGFVDARGGWLVLLYLGLIALAWPLSRVLPQVSVRPQGAGLGWHELLWVAVVPAVATPLILWKVPTGVLPVLIADYLALHFLVYGAITGLGVWTIARRRRAAGGAPAHERSSWWRLAAATGLATAYFALVLPTVTDRYVTSLLPIPERMPVIMAVFVGVLSYLLADDWATRGQGAKRGAVLATRLLFLMSLLLAVALNLRELFFLIIIVPAILVLFVVFGVMSRWVYERTRHPWVGSVACAAALALAISGTFPIVGA